MKEKEAAAETDTYKLLQLQQGRSGGAALLVLKGRTGSVQTPGNRRVLRLRPQGSDPCVVYKNKKYDPLLLSYCTLLWRPS